MGIRSAVYNVLTQVKKQFEDKTSTLPTLPTSEYRLTMTHDNTSAAIYQTTKTLSSKGGKHGASSAGGISFGLQTTQKE